MKFIAMFAGPTVRDLVMQESNGLGNAMNLESNAHQAYNGFKWAIQANENNGRVRIDALFYWFIIHNLIQITYIFKTLLDGHDRGSGYINLNDGHEIPFGAGPDGAALNVGPSPMLCNLLCAVARVLRMSGAADLLPQLKNDADDSEFPHVYLASAELCNILSAKLLRAQGRALYT